MFRISVFPLMSHVNPEEEDSLFLRNAGTSQHGLTYQKTLIFINLSVRIPNLEFSILGDLFKLHVKSISCY